MRLTTIAFFNIVDCESGSLRLQDGHNYFHQVQGQLFLSNKKCCDLIVWTKIDMQVIRISRDEKWKDNIGRLIKFYFSYFIPLVQANA